MIEANKGNSTMKNDYEVICRNIGSVYRGSNLAIATKVFREYWDQSDSQYGRASGEDVTLMANGEPIKTHYGKNAARE
jgi:hypothetical protein